MRPFKIAVAIALLFAAVAVKSAFASEIYTATPAGPALEGYDAVAYFEAGRPLKGSPEHASRYKDITWMFANAANKAAFDADPERFAPRYGGHCAWGTARGYAVRGDPLVWEIVDGRLYLNYNSAIQEKWQRDTAGFIATADRNWPQILKAKTGD